MNWKTPPSKEQKTKLYVAYGSNMNIDQMAMRCPESTPFDVGTVQGYSLEFNRVATLCKNKDATAPCVLWNITAEHEKALDGYEGYPYKYTKVQVPVVVNGEKIKAMAYVMKDSSHRNPPKEEYFTRIYDGYAAFGIRDDTLFEALLRAEEAQEKRIEKEYAEFKSQEPKYITNDMITAARIEGFRAAVTYGEYVGLIDEGTEQSLKDRDILSLISYYAPTCEHTTTLTKQDCDYKYYIAYGSNINLNDMKHRCPNSEVVGVKMLKGYELVFDGCASIEKNSAAVTPVLLWKIHRTDWKALDRYEGYPSYYRKEEISLNSKSEGKMSATVYIMNRDNKAKYSPPSNFYIQTIIEGYKANGIDLKYLNDALEKNLRQNGLLEQQTKSKPQEHPQGRKK